MALFNMNFNKPGPGVAPDAPRKKGAARFFEILGRDFGPFWLAGMLSLLSAVPWAFGLWFSIETHALAPLLVAGIVGGMLAAPQLVGLYDTILRALRDEPGYWWQTYRRAWKRNAKASLLPGAIWGLLLGMQIFALYHLDYSTNMKVGVVMAIGALLLLGLSQFVFAQIALLEMPFLGILKNALLLFLGYLPRAALGLLWQALYWGAVFVFWPVSALVLVLTSAWLPGFLCLMAIYPPLNKSFDLEAKIKSMRDAQLNGNDENKQ